MQIMITDSHCHLASGRFTDDERAGIISNAVEAGVHRIVTLATCLEEVPKNLNLANHRGVRAAIGIHPCEVHNAPDDAVEMLSRHVTDPRVCAIGETGLDYFHQAPDGWDEGAFRKRQQDFLRQHFELAADTGLNVVIHTRDREGSASFDDALRIYTGFSETVRAVFHCFISGWEMAERVTCERRAGFLRRRGDFQKIGTGEGNRKALPGGKLHAGDRFPLPCAGAGARQTQRTGLHHAHRAGGGRTSARILGGTRRTY